MFAPPQVRQIVQLLACIAGVLDIPNNFHQHAIPAPPVGARHIVPLPRVVGQQEQNLLPSRSLHQERIDLDWNREAYMLSLRPHLVIIHRSAFFHALNAELGLVKSGNKTDDERWQAVYELAEDKLISFTAYIALQMPRTRFLVYSRGTDPQWTNDFWRTNTWIKSVETRYPELKGRITPVVIPHGYKGSFREPEAREHAPEPTPRQRQVIQLLAEGRSMKEIADLLKITMRTVASHKYRVMEVLQIKTSAELVRYAVKHRIV